MDRWKFFTLGVLLILTCALWYTVVADSGREFRVVFLNVGQGDAAFIETPSGVQILIDGGAGSRVLGELARVMPVYDRSLDVVVATHTDLDHIGGLASVLERYQVDMVVENGATADSAAWREFEEHVINEGSIRHKVIAGERLWLGDGAYFDVLGPKDLEWEEAAAQPNDVMVVLKLVYQESSILFGGDIERADEVRLALSGANLASDILKVAHHGSKTSSSALFLEKVQPEIAVISAGERNRYGHPHAEVLDRLKTVGVRIVRTDLDGRICFVASATSWQACSSPWEGR